jgi:hypothetical protein
MRRHSRVRKVETGALPIAWAGIVLIVAISGLLIYLGLGNDVGVEQGPRQSAAARAAAARGN